MGDANATQDRVKYQFAVDRDLWTDWKDTVPRSKALRDRLAELVERDLEQKR